jgi:(2Fe-2S) ferredoxin
MAAWYTPAMPPYERHVFVCENRRAEDDPRGCCAARGSEAIRERLKVLAKNAGHGPTIVVYPEAIWYGGVTLDDVDEIFESHVMGGKPVERLRLPHMRPPER